MCIHAYPRHSKTGLRVAHGAGVPVVDGCKVSFKVDFDLARKNDVGVGFGPEEVQSGARAAYLGMELRSARRPRVAKQQRERKVVVSKRAAAAVARIVDLGRLDEPIEVHQGAASKLEVGNKPLGIARAVDRKEARWRDRRDHAGLPRSAVLKRVRGGGSAS